MLETQSDEVISKKSFKSPRKNAAPSSNGDASSDLEDDDEVIPMELEDDEFDFEENEEDYDDDCDLDSDDQMKGEDLKGGGETDDDDFEIHDGDNKNFENDDILYDDENDTEGSESRSINVVDDSPEKKEEKKSTFEAAAFESASQSLGFLKCGESTQEPWPKDVKLFQPYEVEQILLPDNANCLAVQAFLKMCDLDFQVESRSNAEAMSPSGKVPFIKAGAFIISELEPIVQFINNKGITLTDKLEPDMKSDLRAYMSLVHNVMEVAELYICWCDKETYNEVTSVRHGSIYPWPLNHFQNRAKRAAVIKKLKVLGWYNKSIGEVFQEVANCCQALTDRLDKNNYFFEDKPTELDALVFGHLFTILTTPLPNSQLAKTVRNYPELIHLVERIERDYFKKETKH